MTNIPAGYQLRTTTWENDGDSYKTQIISGLTKETVAFYIELGSLFESASRGTGGFGNRGCTEGGDAYHNNDLYAVMAAIAKVVSNHPEADAEVLDRYSVVVEDADEFSEVHENLIEDILGWTEDYYDEQYFCRVVDKVEVFFYNAPIENVTAQFI